MKLHRVLVAAVIDAVERILSEGQYADRVIEKLLRSNPQWGARDRAFLAESCYNLVRYWRLYKYCSRDQKNNWRIFESYLVLKKIPLPDWEEFKQCDKEKIFKKYEEAQSIRCIRESLPDWLDSLGVKELGENWDRELAALNEEARVVLRCNTLKVERSALKEILQKEGIVCHAPETHPDALVLNQRKNVFKSEYFKKGFFEVQDASSQLVAPFLQVTPGMRVVDACAGAGGKSLHLAALMQNKGSLICLDTEEWKLNELKLRARRNGVSVIETRKIESNKTIKRLYGTADRLLLDVPCSGLGVLRRNPDAKWKLNKEYIDRMKKNQEEILQSYAKILKPGGKLVYATCSMLPSENQEQVARFLQNNPTFSLEQDLAVSPADSGFDGFYMARMVQT